MPHLSKPFAPTACALAVSLLVAACGGEGSYDAPAESVRPTLVIDDNIPGATARASVTFTFTFSESVGSSFTMSDVVVEGGTPVALIKVNDQKYILEVVPAANAQGVLRVSVAAGAFTDRRGNANLAGATHQQAFNTVTAPPPSGGDVVLASFDETPALSFQGFNGAETSAIAAGPAGATGNTGKIIRLGGEVWAGAKVNVGSPIALTASNRTISARVYSPTAGVPMVLKLENESDPGINTGDIQATQAVVAGWQTLTWVVPADKVGPQYSWVVMLPNLGTRASDNPGETYYFDDIKLVVPPVSSDLLIASFDEAPALVFTGFNGAETSSLAAGPAGGTGNTAKIVRLGGEVWAGAKVDLESSIPLTATNRTISARVYSATAGVPMVLKLEDKTNGSINTGDLPATQSVVVGWQTLTWVVPADKVGPAYTAVVMLPNLGTRANDNPGETYYFDDIKLVLAPASTGTVLASFEEAPALSFAGFNGAETSAIAAGPAGGSGNAAKIIRLGGEVWAGAKVNVGAPIALTTNRRTISARVFSPTAGVPIVLKLENESDAGINTGDIQATQAVVAGWQTLTWVVPANKVGPQYSWVVMLPNLGTRANDNPGETYYFDDIKLD